MAFFNRALTSNIRDLRPLIGDNDQPLATIKSQVSRLCGEIDERVGNFLSRPIEGEWPYVWLDATYVKARRDHHIVSVAVIVAVGVNTDGRREVLGMTVGPQRGRALLGRVLAQPGTSRVARGKVGDLGCA